MVRKNYTIIGVAAPRFTWDDADVYLPQKITQDQNHTFYVGGHLKPGISRAAAQSALEPLIRAFAQQTPKHFPTGTYRFLLLALTKIF
jgi:hypothetical protein